MIFVRGMHGLGDNIYQRAVIRAWIEIRGIESFYLETPWPQLYADLPQVRCVRPVTRLRTQSRNAGRAGLKFWPAPYNAREIRPHYVNRPGGLLQALCEAYGVQPDVLTFDLPAFPVRPAEAPYAVIRPATVRSEWPAQARNPRAEYLAAAAIRLRRDMRVVSVADLEPGAEWPDGELPEAGQRHHRGELELEALLGLVAGATACVGGVGWIVPACIALKVPLFLIFGGWGEHHGPQRILDPRLDTSRIQCAIPKRFCMCTNRSHACDKRIERFDDLLDDFALGLTATRLPAVAA